MSEKHCGHSCGLSWSVALGYGTRRIASVNGLGSYSAMRRASRPCESDGPPSMTAGCLSGSNNRHTAHRLCNLPQLQRWSSLPGNTLHDSLGSLQSARRLPSTQASASCSNRNLGNRDINVVLGRVNSHTTKPRAIVGTATEACIYVPTFLSRWGLQHPTESEALVGCTTRRIALVGGRLF
jgi:hypothetical protein